MNETKSSLHFIQVTLISSHPPDQQHIDARVSGKAVVNLIQVLAIAFRW